jgi:flagellar FliL protein
MADEEGDIEDGEEGDLTEGLEKKKLSGKKIVIFAGIGVLVIVLALVVWIFLSGDDEENIEGVDGEGVVEEVVEDDVPAFLPLDEFAVNLNTGGRQSRLFSVVITLQLQKESDREAIEIRMPVIRDYFTIYLRELREEELQGSGGIFRLKEELLRRINAAIAPIHIRDILFKNILVQ